MTADENESAPAEARAFGLAELVLLLIAPCLLLGPIVLTGSRFLPFLPVGQAPLAADHPDAAQEAFDGANLVLGDRIYPMLSDQLAMGRELEAGRFPSWEPLVSLGAPLFAGTINGPAYPPNWLAFVVPPEWAAGLLSMLSLFLAGLGMWLLLGRLGFARGSRAVGVLATQLGGWGVANLYYFQKVDAAIWLPWALWAVEGIARGRRWSGSWLTLAVACSFLSGFPQIAVFVLSLTGLYALLRLTPLGRGLSPSFEQPPAPVAVRAFPAAILFLVLGVLGSGVQLFPSFEASRLSTRTERSTEGMAAESLVPATLFGTVVHDFVGEPRDRCPSSNLPVAWWLTPEDQWFKAEAANTLEWNTYAGCVCVLLALTGLFGAPRRAAFPFAALLVCIGFAQAWLPLRWLYGLPGFNIGAVSRTLGAAWFLWPWLAAVGMQSLFASGRARSLFLLFAFVLTATGFYLWTSFDPAAWAADLEQTLVERYGESHGKTLAEIREVVTPDHAFQAGERLADSFAAMFAASLSALLAGALLFVAARGGPSSRGHASPRLVSLGIVAVAVVALSPLVGLETPASTGLSPIVAGLAGAALLAAIVLRRGTAWGGRIWLAFGLAVVIEGTFAADGHLKGFDTGSETFPPSSSIEAVREAAGDGRVLRLDTSASGIAQVERLARPNMLQVYGIADLSTYAAFTATSLVDLCRRVDPGMIFRVGVGNLTDPARLDHPILDLLRVQAILSVDALEHERLEPVLEREGFHVYRRRGALAPARVVGRARRVSSSEEAVDLLAEGRVDFARETLLLAADAPGAAQESASPGQLESFERPASNRLRLSVWGSSGGWLVVHEQFAPGWRATVNGESVPILRADHVYRAVRLPRGDSVIEMEYAPDSIRLGALSTVLALLSALALGALRPRSS